MFRMAGGSRIKLWLVSAIFVGAVLRLWNLGSGELLFDEGLYAFRSIGYLDYLESPSQLTPIQLFLDAPLPKWTYLSFHDHPPLFFLIQHWFFGLFEDSLFVARLPSALAGIISLFLFFLIFQKLLSKFNLENSELGAVLGVLIAGVSFSHIALSRLSMMESALFLLILINIYFFLRFLEAPKKHWLFFGLTLGLAFLAKYTATFLIPSYFIFLIIADRQFFKNKYLYFSLLIAAILFLPVIIYNLYFYGSFGHFDLQFSYFFGQVVPEWQGESSGKTQEPFSAILSNITAIYSIPFLLLAIAGMAATFFTQSSFRWLMPLMLIFITLMLIGVGSAIRFVSFYLIPGIFFVALALLFIFNRARAPRIKKAAGVLIAGFFIYESFLTVNAVFINPPDYGIVKLDNYLESIFGGARPETAPRHPNPHLDQIIQKYAVGYPNTLGKIGIIYDDSISTPARLWLFSRRQYYQGIPIMPASSFAEIIESGGKDNFSGLTLYFIKAGPGTTIRPISFSYAEQIEVNLKKSGAAPELQLKDFYGQEAFSVYRFSFK